jgi:cytochrome c oxidase assembly protein subunit 15
LSKTAEACHGKRLIFAGILTIAVVYCQLIIGAIMRHEQAGLAIPDVPLVYGTFLPPSTPAELGEANVMRAWKYRLPPVTLGQIWIHYAHRLGALVVSFVVVALVTHVLLFHRRRGELIRPALALLGLLFTQLVLGLATVYYGKPADVASAHVAVGALVLVTSFTLTVRASRLYKPRSAVLNLSPQSTVLSPSS